MKQYYLENFSNFERFLFTFSGTKFFFLITSFFFIFVLFFLVLTENKQVLEKKQLFLNIGRNEMLRCSMQNKTNYVRRFIYGKYQDANSTSGKRIRTSDNGELFIDRVQESDGGLMNAEDWNMFIIT